MTKSLKTPANPTKWMSYKEASNWAQQEGVRSQSQWFKRVKEGPCPENLPKHPSNTYKEEFTTWGEFLGTGVVAPQKRVFWPIEKVKEWARQEGIKSSTEWAKRCKKGLPDGVPAQPFKVYKAEFRGWGEFLGTGRVASKNKIFVSYEQSKEWAKENNVKSQLGWKAMHKKIKPIDIPLHPHRVYKEHFKNWGDFLGTGRIANKDREFLTCEEVIAWAREEGISSHEEWYQRTKKNFPNNIPVSPNQVYGENFKWGDLFNRKNRNYFGRVSYKNYVTEENLLSYDEALKWGRESGICSSAEWQERCKIDVPPGIPARPHKVYSEFKSWGDFLGLKYVNGMSKIERMIRYVLECALDEVYTEYAQPVITGVSQKKHRVDMCFRSLDLIIEYDGEYWHQHKTAKDRKKTKDLVSAGWNVVRVRGGSLVLIQDNWDMSIDESSPAYVQIYEIIRHLISLDKVGMLNIQKELSDWSVERIQEINFREVLEKYDNFISYEEASAWARKANISSGVMWRQMSKKGLLPNLPSCPATTYGSQFKGWGDFLGTGRFIRNKEKLVSYIEASAWARSKGVTSAPQWWALSKDGKIPRHIPASPSVAYKQEFKDNGGWYGFLGKKKPTKRTKNVKG